MTTLTKLGVLALALLAPIASAQSKAPVNVMQQTIVAGLRANAGQGNFPAAAYAPDGSALYVLYDQRDGVRVLKLSAAGTSVLAQSLLGAMGDSAVALAVDPGGNVYVTGTTTSGQIQGTVGAAYATRADASVNSFLAKYDANLSPVFVTYLGSGRTAATSVAATADAAFVTGITYNQCAVLRVDQYGFSGSLATSAAEHRQCERHRADRNDLRPECSGLCRDGTVPGNARAQPGMYADRDIYASGNWHP